MIVFIVGTTAELIKVQPVYSKIRSVGTHAEIWTTNQQPRDLAVAFEDLGVNEDLALSGRKDNLEKRSQVPGWLVGNLAFSLRQRRRLLRRLTADGLPGLIVVHGDTMTSVLGVVLAKVLGVKCAHVEAGLRSHNLRNPFPEELNRRIVGRIADLHYAPTEEALDNLERRKGTKVLTRGNTIEDAIRTFSPKSGTADGVLVSLHRGELLNNRDILRETFQALIEAASHTSVTLVTDSLTLGALETSHLLDSVIASKIRVLPKQPYTDFLAELAGSSAVITDSGGLQEECAILGKPCLVHRLYTERQDGLGRNARLSGMNPTQVLPFALSHEDLRVTPNTSDVSPSEVIFQHLGQSGYLGRVNES